jgi:hypothetical protein
MAASGRTNGVNDQTPGAEAHNIVELLRRESHSTFHLSCYECVYYCLAYGMDLSLHAGVAYHERGAIVKRARLRLSADVSDDPPAFFDNRERSENPALMPSSLRTRSRLSADVRPR